MTIQFILNVIGFIFAYITYQQTTYPQYTGTLITKSRNRVPVIFRKVDDFYWEMKRPYDTSWELLEDASEIINKQIMQRKPLALRDT